MKTLYIDCSMGAAGDMLNAALYELIDNKEEYLEKMNSLGLDSVSVKAEKSVKCGLCGTHMSVLINGAEESELNSSHPNSHHTHSHKSLKDEENIINSLDIPQKVKRDALGIFSLIATAESEAHGMPVSDIHFHEVGTADAVADIVGACLLINIIGAEKIISSPVRLGKGSVKCAHGILAVPAPATASVLRGVPVYAGDIQGELCTPTGAAILKYFSEKFCDMPHMTVERIGCGMGKKDFEQANCLRAFLGVSDEKSETICELKCNIDDMSAEDIAFAAEILLKSGAKDVCTQNVVMKKGRQGTKLECICRVQDRDKMIKLIFRHTSTLGVREYRCERFTLERFESVKDTPLGRVHIKTSRGFGVERSKAEYEDRAKIAKENDISLSEVDKNIK